MEAEPASQLINIDVTIVTNKELVYSEFVFPTGSAPGPLSSSVETKADTSTNSVRRLFETWSKEWKAATGPLATVRAISSHPAYKRIIQLGEEMAEAWIRWGREHGYRW